MLIEPLLAFTSVYFFAKQETNSIIDINTGRLFNYAVSQEIYDYNTGSYIQVIKEEKKIKLHDYKSGSYYWLKVISPNKILAHQIGSDDYYEININEKEVSISYKKKNYTSIYRYK